MTELQKVIKYLAIAFAIFLAISIIISIVSLICNIFFYDVGVLDEMREIEISQNIDRIHIEIGAAHLKVVEGDRFALSTNLEKLNVTCSDTRLYIEQRQRVVVSIHSTNNGEVILTVPSGVVFESFELEAGAGEVNIQFLNSDRVNFEFGAGRVSIGNLVATGSAEIETGAGELIIADGRVNNLDLDLGVGKTELRASLAGECSINCGVGETNVSIKGKSSDYSMRISTGIGSVTVDGTALKGNTVLGNGSNKLNIEGGVGTVNIEFEDD